ncbi:Oxidoreductase swnR [Fusarium oxysporum f. sp. cubense]|uniref:Oxidoreductase swnR n=1 Tax=Fusarium oxysporum f. sp. cubense TaxID=61366 RepID=A0A559L4H4_FUSOC|nr:Oxidoreductase swnR [Fusarium oxysporum f. sp. cubense]
MSIAIAGSGDLARYMVEEFPRAGLDLVILTRTYKPHLAKEGVQQFMTDYSSTSLDEALRGCKALISTIVDMSQTYVDIHLQLLAACRRSASCKRFIPSEFAGNTRDYPDQPAYFRNINERVRQALKQQDQVEWTIVCIGFFADYFVPASSRYIRNMREGSLIDFDNEKFSVPGSLQDSIDITLARDVVKGLVALVNGPSWAPYTFMSGQRLTWREIVDTIRRERPKFTVQVSTLNEVIDTLMPGNSVDDITFAQLQLYSASGAARCPEREVEKQKQEYFRDIHFHTLQEIWNQFNDNKTIIF